MGREEDGYRGGWVGRGLGRELFEGGFWGLGFGFWGLRFGVWGFGGSKRIWLWWSWWCCSAVRTSNSHVCVRKK